MVNRPNSFDISTPTGAASPRQGDDELRRIKEFTQNAYNDLHTETGVGVTHQNLYGLTITADTEFVGDLTGNADTATQFEVAPNITLEGDVAGTFALTGNTDVTVATTIQPDSVALGVDTTGQYAQTIVGTTDEVTVSTIETSDGTDYTISLPTTINANTTGNAATATALETSRDFDVSGDVSADAVSFDGTGNVTLDISVNSVQANAVALGTDTTGQYAQTIVGTSNEVTVSTAETSDGTDYTISLPDTINADTTGNAATATNVPYSGLTGTVPTWNQDTTGNAATSSSTPYSGLTGSVPIWNQDTTGNAATSSSTPYSGLTGAVPTWNQDTTGNAATASAVPYSGLTGAIPTWNQDTTGNAATADALSTARNIGGVSFDGSADIDLPGVNTSGTQDTTGNAATANAWSTARTLTLTAAGGNGVTGSVSIDGSGNATLDTTLVGTVATGVIENANTLSNPRNFSIGGDITAAAVSFNGSADVALSATIDDNVVDAAALNVSGNGTSGQFLSTDGDGSFSWVTQADTNTTYTAGGGLDLSGTVFSHTDTSSQASVNNTGRTYIQDITLDTYGHITAITSATETVTDTNTTYSAGTGIGLSGTTFSVTGGTGITADTNGVSLTGNGVGADQLNVSGDGTTSQFLRSDGDGSFTWATPANTTYSAGNGISLSGTTFSVAGGTGLTQNTSGLSITNNGVGATQLNVTGNGTTAQFLRSDADGSFTWATPTDTNTTYPSQTGTVWNAGTVTAESIISPSKLAAAVAAHETPDSGNTTYSAGTGIGLSGTTFSVTGGTGITANATGVSVTSNGIGATQLNVSGNGSSTQFLRSDGDGSFSWATPTDTNTTYSAGNGISLSGTTFSVAAGNGLSQSTTGLAFNFSRANTWTATQSATDFCITSDERLKTEIEDICCPLDKVNSLRGVTYKKDGEQQLGVIAQEIEKILPEVVKEGEDGFKVVSYNQIVGVLIGAVQELSAQVEELKNDSRK